MKKLTPIEAIREEVNKYKGNELDFNIKEWQNLDSFYNIFFTKGFKKTLKDIKLVNIVEIGRSDHWGEDVRSWRYLINNWIHGKDWEDGIFEYFENEIEEKKFPASSSHSALVLEDYQGLIRCTNGNHRIIGAYAWMICKYGKDAILKKVITHTSKINPVLIDFIKELKDDDDLFCAYNFVYDKKYLKIENSKLNNIKIYELSKTNELALIGEFRIKPSFTDVLIKFKKKYIDSIKYNEYNDITKYINGCEWEVVNKRYLDILKESI